MTFHGEKPIPSHLLTGLRMGEYARMNPDPTKAWGAHYAPENQAFIDRMQTGALTDGEVTRWKNQRYMHDYLGSVQAVDDSV